MRFQAWATIVVLLWITMMERAVHALFVVSLAALGVSPTMLAIPLLFSSFIYAAGLHKWWPHSGCFIRTTTFLALAAMLTTTIAPGNWTVMASAVAVVAMTVLLFDATARLGPQMLGPSVVALLLAITLRIVNHTAAVGLTQRGTFLLIALLAAAAILGWSANRNERPVAESAGGAAVLIAFLLLEYQLLGVPSAIATLHPQNMMNGGAWFFMLMAAAQLGLLAGLYLAPGRRAVVRVAAVVCFIASTLIVTGVAYVAAPVWLFMAQAAAVVLLASAFEHTQPAVRTAGTRAGLLQVTWWLLVVLHAFSTKWPFLPAFTWPILQDRAMLYLVASLAMLPIAALLRRRLS